MTARRWILAAVGAGALVGADAARSQMAADATEPRLFAPGVVSTPDDEFGGAFTPDGKTVVFDKSVVRHYLYVICESHFENGAWSTPRVAPFSGSYRDSDPVFSPDGSKLYFVSDRPVNGVPKTDFDIWVVARRGDGWGEPEHLDAPINSEYGEYFASAASNGDLYFSSARPGGKGGLDVYRSRFVDGKYAAPENLGDAINSESWELDCLVAPDASFLIVGAIGRPDSVGNFDLYVSYPRDGGWTPLALLSPKVNTAARDYSPRLSPDGRTLVFTSERDFATMPLAKPLTTDELEQGLKSVCNGSGNIYQIDLRAAGIVPPHAN
jgi:Tol biopolymer transport system component